MGRINEKDRFDTNRESLTVVVYNTIWSIYLVNDSKMVAYNRLCLSRRLIFISHKNEDAALAIQSTFSKNGVTSYLDVLDSSITSGGKELTDHIKNNLNLCSDIIVVMSDSTKYS